MFKKKVFTAEALKTYYFIAKDNLCCKNGRPPKSFTQAMGPEGCFRRVPSDHVDGDSEQEHAPKEPRKSVLFEAKMKLMIGSSSPSPLLSETRLEDLQVFE